MNVQYLVYLMKLVVKSTDVKNTEGRFQRKPITSLNGCYGEYCRPKVPHDQHLAEELATWATSIILLL